MRITQNVKFILCSLAFLLSLKTMAQSPAIMQDSTAGRKIIKGFIPIPIVYYTPDTRLGLGAGVIGFFKLPSHTDTTYTRLSVTRLLLDYTLNKQTDQLLDWNIFTRDERYLLRGELRHRVYADRFYGIGNNTPEINEEKYKYNYASFRFGALKNIGKQAFIGPDVQITNYYNVKLDSIDKERDSQLRNLSIPGSEGGLNSGLGLVFLIDSRDNVAYASSGMYLEASVYRYSTAFGSDFSYNNINFDFRKYFQLKPDHILAFNTSMMLTNGEVPVMRLAQAGGDRMLRGYAKNRFLENNFAGAQAEYRLPLAGSFGMVAFAGIGDVFGKPADVSFSTLKYSLGSGLRYALDKKQKMNARLDVGYGREGINFYVVIGESF
ncbi:BamA/TamA family outer membrane protein [Pontibacter vulgaris]|uniref:BamA/TamA family outer membrane protein n=1 Tax=Pontibacter vulgaris TaxID=2905679 RepID=UPI001FA70DCE|nr:BamA/TamA family outer membrane protein [Pontibacter vulgaris]